MAGIRKATEQQQKNLVELFEATDFLDYPVETYSSGMLKKLSLIMAFLGSTQLIILDEPLATLDNNSQLRLAYLLEERSRQQETIYLFSSHQPIGEVTIPITRYMIDSLALQKC